MSEERQSTFRDFFLNVSFHGYRYITERNSHLIDRVFWIICCTFSWVAVGLLISSAWNDFENNSISFVVDTSYLDWDTSFPSIAVCENDNQERIAEVTDRIFGDPHDYNLDEIVKELVFYRGLNFYTLQICGPEAQAPNESCLAKNFSEFESLVRSTCTQIFKKCKWNDAEFDCCEYFGEMDTEMGLCYAINSLQNKNQKQQKFQMLSNKNDGPGSLFLELNGLLNVYILGEQDVPSLTTLTTDILQITPGIHYHRYIALKEIENQPEVKDVGIKQRKCRFIDETEEMDVYPHYSYSACCVQCRKNAQRRVCDCSHHLMPNTPRAKMCNISGLYCINKHNEDLSVLKPYWASRTGLVCDCLPSCTELEFSTVKDDRNGIGDGFSIVEITLERLPTERYKRNVVRGKLDLVVSMGGGTALFLGASLLSFVEVIFHLIVRPISNSLVRRRSINSNKKFRLVAEAKNKLT